MKTLINRNTIFTLLTIQTLSMAEGLQSSFPIGLSLGHKFLRSAYYDSENQLRVFPAFQVVKSGKITSLLPCRVFGVMPSPYDDPQNLELSAKTISSIIAATTEALSKENTDFEPIKVRSISVPQQFDGRSSMVNIMRIAKREGYIGKGNQVISHFNSARLAYNLDNYMGYGYPEGTDVDGMENFVFVVDLGTTYLSLGFVITGTILFAPVGVRHWADYKLDGSDSDGKNAGSLPASTINMIQDFLAERLELLTDDVPDLPSHVVAVILTGESSPACMEDMKSVLQIAIPAFIPKFKFVKDPSLVAVEGAAHRARQAVTDPYFIEPDTPGDHEHLERAETPSVDRFHDEL